MRISKMCLKQCFFHSKWVFQAILSLTVLSNCFSVISNFDTLYVEEGAFKSNLCALFYSIQFVT